MNLNKKYILSILFLFSIAHTSTNPLSRLFSIEKISDEIPIDIAHKACIYAIGIACMIPLLHYIIMPTIVELCSNQIFYKEPIYTDNYYQKMCFSGYVFNEKKTLSYIEKYRTIIHIILKFFLFFNHTSTQFRYSEYILQLYCYKEYKEIEPIIRFLFECGINPRFVQNPQAGLLARACLKSDSIELVKYLLENLKLDPNNRDRIKRSVVIGYENNSHAIREPFVGPVYGKHSNIVKRIDQMMADRECIGIASDTIRNSSDPLHRACYSNNNETVKLLIKHNTHTHPFLDVNTVDTSPILEAINHNNKEMFLDLYHYTKEKSYRKICKQIWHLSQIAEEKNLPKDLQKYIILSLIDSSSFSSDHLDNCFICDETIWLPHNTDLDCDLLLKAPYRKDKYFEGNIDEVKTSIKEFLSTHQITC